PCRIIARPRSPTKKSPLTGKFWSIFYGQIRIAATGSGGGGRGGSSRLLALTTSLMTRGKREANGMSNLIHNERKKALASAYYNLGNAGMVGAFITPVLANHHFDIKAYLIAAPFAFSLWLVAAYAAREQLGKLRE